ncbi:MAG TPA: hypothetical protein VGM37_14585 [Armatimonadota bacterium]|jgi:hypothetical protein
MKGAIYVRIGPGNADGCATLVPNLEAAAVAHAVSSGCESVTIIREYDDLALPARRDLLARIDAGEFGYVVMYDLTTGDG